VTDPLRICQWLEDSQFGTALHESTYMFPLIETTHVLGLAVSVGLILMTDLRLVGAFMRDQPVSEVTVQLKGWMWSGFAVMFATGALLFWSEAAKCYTSPTFRWKIVFLFLAGLNALVFETTVGRAVSSWGALSVLPSRAKFAGWASLICWTGVILFGRWTAYGMK
jgi:hypothetical protein